MNLQNEVESNGAGFGKLNEMYDTFNLTNLTNSETCYTKNYKSLIDLFFTNKPLSFQKTHVTETGLSDITNSFPHFSNRDFQRLDQRS